MHDLAYDKEGNPIRFSRRTKKLRARRWKNAGLRGTCATVVDATGEPILIDADAEFAEFRAAIGNVPGFYRLDQCDEDGAPIEDAPPAYVSIESQRNAPTSSIELDGRDAIIRDLVQSNADAMRALVGASAGMMQAVADVLRAADGAGLPRREPPPVLPSAASDAREDQDDEDDEDEEDEESDDHEEPSGRVWTLVEEMLPAVRAWLTSLTAKRSAPSSMPPAAAPPPAPVPAPAPAVATAAAPSTGAVAGSAAAGASSGEAAAPVAPQPPPATSAESPISPPPAVAPEPTGHGAPTSITVAGSVDTDVARNAELAVGPTPEQWAHLIAIRSRLLPREAAIAEAAVFRMSPELRAQWLAKLSAISIDEAVEVLRSMIPPAPAKSGAPSNGQ